MKRLPLIALLAASLFVFEVFCAHLLSAAPLTSTHADQTQVSLTVYNSNLGLVKDVREIELAEGLTHLQFMDVAARIMPTTVLIRSQTDPENFQVLEQNYEYDLLSPDTLLEKYVGKEVRLLDKNYFTGKDELVTATLLATNDSPIYQVGDEISIGLPGRVILPQLPANLIAQPTLVWLLQAQAASTHTIEASYLTNDMTWQADYVLALNSDDSLADLSGWVSIENQSGTTYRNATLKLVAGNINRVQPEVLRERLMAATAMASASSESQFQEESFFEYHLYTLERPTTVQNNQTKQMALLSAADIPITKRLVLRGQPHYVRTSFDTPPPLQKVSVYLEIENVEQHHLGIPLPKGTLRVYKADAQGSLQFVGEDSIDHTPKNETVSVKMGEAFDVVGERRQTSFTRLSRRSSEVSWQIVVRNHKDEDVQVRVEEPMYGDWEVVASTPEQHEKPDAHTLRFEVTVPKNGEVKIGYRVRVKT
ncbi:MAG: DUF4139 domain-containing protein [Desulfurellaceae bacterium]|nr:DUF4139 domain-containing protein [Desulfurellaceae bacterium]